MHNKYSYKEVKNILKQDLEIPECVENSINEAFEKIDKNYDMKKVENKVVKIKRMNKIKKCAAAIAAIMILGTGTTVTAKTVMKWNDKVAEKFGVDDEMQNDLMEEGIATALDVKDTVNGVTIETDQMVADDKYMYVLFKITAPEDMILTKDTFFQSFRFECEGDTENNIQLAGVDGGLYGIEPGEEFQEDGKTNVVYWEIFVQKNKDLNGKKFTASFVDLGKNDNVNKTGVTTLVEGTWNLSWTLNSPNKSLEKKVKTKINNSDTVVKKVRLTPLSIFIQYDFPKKELTAVEKDEIGREVDDHIFYENPERAYKVRMKDGTLKDIPNGGPGHEGYTSRFTSNFESDFGFDKALDIDNVQSIIFGEGETETEIDLR